ncbi:MAG: hypothetical protein IT167_30735 [Bryobacterales bacterium]|nr:hypothetical protein [Bryobacterales bacterium]
MRALVLLCCFAAAIPAQAPQPAVPPVPDALRQYFDLSPDQVDALARLNDGFDHAAYPLRQRMAQLEQEIASLTAEAVPDPMALGVRYAEMEAIRRQLKDNLGKLRADARGTMTDEQRARLDRLDEAVRLQSVITQAGCFRLLLTSPADSSPACAELRKEP